MHEHRKSPPPSWNPFRRRLVLHGGAAFLVLAVSLFIGVLGYHLLAHLNWVDSLLNASMILGGMGPVDTLHTSAAKIFASCYAIFSGVMFLGVVGLLFLPVIHRLLKRFDLDPSKEEKKPG